MIKKYIMLSIIALNITCKHPHKCEQQTIVTMCKIVFVNDTTSYMQYEHKTYCKCGKLLHIEFEDRELWYQKMNSYEKKLNVAAIVLKNIIKKHRSDEGK